MTPHFHPFLVNGRYGDPVVYVAFRFSKRAILFDLGDITALPVKKILRITDVFVSHMHVDHLIGFDHLLRVLIGRDLRVRLFGPEGLVAAIGHKLAAYSWNLAHRVHGNLTFIVTETAEDGASRRVEFRLKDRFQGGHERRFGLTGDTVHEEETLTVRRASLDHGIPSIAYALQERTHVNLWKNRLDALGLGTGPWLNELKAAALRGDPEDRPIHAAWKTAEGVEKRELPLGLLTRECLRFEAGQKVAFVTDARHTEENQRRIVDLARDADFLFIETTFAAGEDALALERGHLTASQAGTLARRAGVRRAEPMHISPRYAEAEDQIVDQFTGAFAGTGATAGGA